LRFNNVRALGTSGALLSTTTLAIAPSAAKSDTEPPSFPGPPIATKASSSLSVSSVRRTILAGNRLLVRGRLRPAGAGRAVALQISSTPGHWTTVDHDRTDRQGRYRLVWRARQAGTKHMRVAFGGTSDLASARRLAGDARIYRPASASWYGPGLYGNKLACGGTLGAGTLGVAHKTLPCGTQVTLYYHGRTVRVPVVDRGPFVAGREFDLTAATKSKLGFGSTGVVLTTR
jgi:rare lipoprotein A